MIITPSIEIILFHISHSYFRRSGPRDAVVEKSMFTSIFDFLEPFLIAIRDFIERRQEELSSININNVNKIEMLRQRLTKQQNAQTVKPMDAAANFNKMGTELTEL